MHYKYCPDCGEKLIEKHAGDDGNVPFCEMCNKYWFDSFASASIVLVVNEYNEIALLTQGYLSDKYKSFVSGYIKPGETAESTAIREVEEEIGLEIKRLEPAGTYWFGMKGILMHAFIGYVEKAEFTLSEEVDAAMWVKAEDAKAFLFPDGEGNNWNALLKKYLVKARKHYEKDI